MIEYFIRIPTYDADSGLWSHMEFTTREDLLAFVKGIFKEPGQYGFDETSLLFNEQARSFNRNKFYCAAPPRSKDYVLYWDTEKEKCRNGVIYKSKGKTWYITRDYYMWLNFLPIYNKEVGKFTFADVRDAQYHMALYEEIAKLSYKHVAILKKRQIASSYFHAAKMINGFWFEEGWVNKIAASLKDYINEKGTWRFLDEYRNFLNTHTAWYRPCQPDKTFNWEQKIETVQGGRKRDVGLKSVMIGITLEKDPTAGVGGPCNFFFHEEAGIAPRMNETLEYLLPALKSGMIYTGMFVAAGSVGDLDQCEPLRDLIFNPDSKDVLAVGTNLMNENGDYGDCGLFIPEQWSMIPCIDEWGNSLVENAVDMIQEERKRWKKDLKANDYQLRISQKPINIEEAFAYRKSSVWPLHLITSQLRKIEDKEYYCEAVELFRDDKGGIDYKTTKKLPIMEFPLSPKTQDKEGAVLIWEHPVKDAPFMTYYASIDPVGEGKTTTSDSLCSIFVYKSPLQVTRKKYDGSVENYIEKDQIVASWCGRFDDITKTHERLEMLIEYYGAWTIVENNISLFIQHMIFKKKQKYLVPKSQILFLKDLGSNNNVFQEYGWKNTGTLFKSHLISYGVNFLTEEVDVETMDDGTIVKTTYGIERVKDPVLLKEMQQYREGLNVDRLVAFCALVAFAKVQQSNRGYPHKIETETNPRRHEQKSSNLTKLNMNPFRNLGKPVPKSGNGFKRQAFRNIK
jgi:hypothetical protein